MTFNVIVKDCAGNTSNTNVTYTWNDTLPTLATGNYTYPTTIKTTNSMNM